jgi:5,10-methenyltetrahydrofolate synthetase
VLPSVPEPRAAADAQRRTLRSQALAAREALAPATRALLTRALVDHLAALLQRLSPSTLAFCWPYRAEPDLRAWVGNWLAAAPQRRAALPVVIDKDWPLVFRRWTPDTVLLPDRHGIPYPAAGEILVPDVVLVPLNAFDAAGFRLGYGGGYFDRTLASLHTLAIGVGFELGRVPTVLPQPHDIPVSWIVTEAGAQPAGTRQAPAR